MNPTGRAMGGRSSCGVCRSGGGAGAVSAAAGEVGLKSSCALSGDGDATIVGLVASAACDAAASV